MIKKSVFPLITSALVILFFIGICFGADALEGGSGNSTGTPKTADDFLGLGFGVGISLTLDLNSDKDRVNSATVVNGIVRVEDEDNARARIMLESHYFFKTPHKFFYTVAPENWGHGPFIAIQPGTDEIIEAVGFGWMIGFKKPGKDSNSSSSSWNLGIGIAVDPNVRVLGDGIEANKPLPDGETAVRFKEESETGFLILASFKF